MSNSAWALLKSRHFLPQFLTQFFNAFNDSIYKNAMIIFITYTLVTANGIQKEIIITLGAGLFILPFYIFSALAGQLADKFPKTQLTRLIKFLEIIFVSIGALAIYLNCIWLMMVVLFLIGTHSTFFGTIKYAVLPELLPQHQLLKATGFIEASTFIAILIGTLVGNVCILTPHGILLTSTIMIAVAIAGFLASLSIPMTPAANPHLKINLNFLDETWQIIKYTRQHNEVFIAIIGISWFWLIGGALISQFPTYTRDLLNANVEVVSLFLSLFSVGVAIGSLCCNKLIKDELNSKIIPLAMLTLTPFLCDLQYASNFPHPDIAITLRDFILSPQYWRILMDIFGLSVAGGIAIVPLYTILQTRSPHEHRARIIACNNIMSSLFMVLSYVAILVLLTAQFTITQIFFSFGLCNIFVVIYLTKLSEVTAIEMHD